MQLTVWNPMREMEDFFTRVNRGFGRGIPASAGGSTLAAWTPAVDISESTKEYLVKAELPGIDKDAVKITVENNMLTLSGERKEEKESNENKVHRIERFYGNFERSFSLPDNVQSEQISADFKDGILHVHLPKAASKRVVSVEVKVK